MSRENPLVSIIIPTYNRAHLIGETLDSVLAQTYQNWECIVVDDGSTDNTDEVMGKYIAEDARFQYHHRPKDRLPGGNAARNYGFELSRGEYIQWFDSDDIMLPKKLQTDISYILSGNYDFTISQSGFINELGNIIEGYWNTNLWAENALNNFIKKHIGWSINSSLWKKISLIKKNLQFDEQLESGQDFLFHIQAISQKLRPRVINEVLVYQRSHRNKIEHTINKAKSKMIIFSYLLKNIQKIGVDRETENYLIRRSIKVVGNLYKTKNWKTAVYFSTELMKSRLKSKENIKLLKLFIFGSIFLLFSKGYDYIR